MSQARPDYRLPAQHLLSVALSTALASCTAQSARKIVADAHAARETEDLILPVRMAEALQPEIHET